MKEVRKQPQQNLYRPVLGLGLQGSLLLKTRCRAGKFREAGKKLSMAPLAEIPGRFRAPAASGVHGHDRRKKQIGMVVMPSGGELSAATHGTQGSPSSGRMLTRGAGRIRTAA